MLPSDVAILQSPVPHQLASRSIPLFHADPVTATNSGRDKTPNSNNQPPNLILSQRETIPAHTASKDMQTNSKPVTHQVSSR